MANWHLSHILQFGILVKFERVINDQKSCESKYGLMGSSAKMGKYLPRESQEWKRCPYWTQNIKVPFGIGHPQLHIRPSLYVCRRVQGPQIFKQNWIILICSRLIIFILITDLGFLSCVVGGGGGKQLGRGYLGWSALIYMSWNKIDLLNFHCCVGCPLGWVCGTTPMHAHMHACA